MRSPANQFPLLPSIALCTSIALGIAGQLLLKQAALLTVGGRYDLSMLGVLILALFVYSSGIVNWIFALRHLRLSIAYPLTSLSYVGILWGSAYWFGEHVPSTRAIGVALIFIGVPPSSCRWPLGQAQRRSAAVANVEQS